MATLLTLHAEHNTLARNNIYLYKHAFCINNAAKTCVKALYSYSYWLYVYACIVCTDFAYQEAFLATYRTWVSPSGLVARLVRRAHHFKPRPHELRSTLSLLTRVVNDLT